MTAKISSYLESLGFVVCIENDTCIAKRVLKNETIKDFSNSNNFYSSKIYTKSGSVFIEGEINDVALLASELVDTDIHSKNSLETILSSCPYKLDELSDELKLSNDSILSEIRRLEDLQLVYKKDDFYFHMGFCEKEVAEKSPTFLIEKYRLCYKTSKELEGTKISENLTNRALLYKSLFLKYIFRGYENAIHN